MRWADKCDARPFRKAAQTARLFMCSVGSISRAVNSRASHEYVYSRAMQLMRDALGAGLSVGLLFLAGSTFRFFADRFRRERVRRQTRARLYALCAGH